MKKDCVPVLFLVLVAAVLLIRTTRARADNGGDGSQLIPRTHSGILHGANLRWPSDRQKDWLVERGYWGRDLPDFLK